MKSVTAMVAGGALVVALWAPSVGAQEIRNDLKDIKEDRQEIREDTREIREDRRELYQDRRELRKDLKAGNRRRPRRILRNSGKTARSSART